MPFTPISAPHTHLKNFTPIPGLISSQAFHAHPWPPHILLFGLLHPSLGLHTSPRPSSCKRNGVERIWTCEVCKLILYTNCRGEWVGVAIIQPINDFSDKFMVTINSGSFKPPCSTSHTLPISKPNIYFYFSKMSIWYQNFWAFVKKNKKNFLWTLLYTFTNTIITQLFIKVSIFP